MEVAIVISYSSPQMFLFASQPSNVPLFLILNQFSSHTPHMFSPLPPLNFSSIFPILASEKFLLPLNLPPPLPPIFSLPVVSLPQPVLTELHELQCVIGGGSVQRVDDLQVAENAEVDRQVKHVTIGGVRRYVGRVQTVQGFLKESRGYNITWEKKRINTISVRMVECLHFSLILSL